MINTQTFLPYKDFEKCASALDNKRLYKQIVECKQILNILGNVKAGLHYKCPKCGNKYATKDWTYCVNCDQEVTLVKLGFQEHPAVLMWKGFEGNLKAYQVFMLREWMKRRWDIDIDFEAFIKGTSGLGVNEQKQRIPTWLGDERLHKSHRAKLYEKDPEHYKQYENDWKKLTQDGLVNAEYYWVTKEGY